MINVEAYKSYNGGKSGNGTYQTIINHIPPHYVYASLFLGNCGVTRRIRPAAISHLNDIDKNVIDAWTDANLPANYKLHNLPALVVLERLKDLYKGLESTVFIYLDAPYLFDSRRSDKPLYKHEMGTEPEHYELLKAIVECPFKVMISHYPHPLYDRMLYAWNKVDFMSMTRNGLALESIYFNYEISGELHDYSFLGGDFREREAHNRIRRNIIKKLERLPALVRNSILSDINTFYQSNPVPGTLAQNSDNAGDLA